jgi:hypothetical protein
MSSDKPSEGDTLVRAYAINARPVPGKMTRTA